MNKHTQSSLDRFEHASLPPKDAEVIAVDISHARYEVLSTHEQTVPCAGLEESLNQIERLAAELQQLATPVVEEEMVVEVAPPLEENDSFLKPPRPAPRRSKTGSAKPPRSRFYTHTEAQSPVSSGGTASSLEPGHTDPEVPLSEQPTQQLPTLPVIPTPVESRPIETTRSRRGAGTGPQNRAPKHKQSSGRRRHWIFACLLAVLAVPALAIAVVQPWKDVSDPVPVGADSTQRVNPLMDAGDMPRSETPSPEDSNNGGLTRPTPKPSTSVSPSTDLRRGEVKGLVLAVHASDVQPVVGADVSFRVEWSDGLGRYAGYIARWGDDSPQEGSVASPRCGEGEANLPNTSGTEQLTHRFSAVGTYTVSISVTTFLCDGTTEERIVPITVHVNPAPTPTPTFSASPTPSETPTGTQTR